MEKEEIIKHNTELLLFIAASMAKIGITELDYQKLVEFINEFEDKK